MIEGLKFGLGLVAAGVALWVAGWILFGLLIFLDRK